MTTLTSLDLSDTIGALQIGSLFGVYLFGVVSLQAYNYYMRCGDDSWMYKWLVASVLLMELGHTLSISYEVYHVTIILYGQPQGLGRFQGIGASTIFGGAITLLVQGFFSIRISKLLPKPYCHIGNFCFVVSLFRFGVSVFLTVVGITAQSMEEYGLKCKTWVSLVFILGAGIDVTIAMSMLYYLIEKRSLAMKRLSKVIDRLMTYSVRSGLLTSISAVAIVICYQTMPNNLIWMGVYTFMAKLYSNSLLSALNARKEMRNDAQKFLVSDFSSGLNSSRNISMPLYYEPSIKMDDRKAPIEP